jgi:uncharacterized protein
MRTPPTTRDNGRPNSGPGAPTRSMRQRARDPDAATHQGIQAIRRQFARWHEAYPDLRVEPLDARANGDRVFLWVRFVGHGAASGLPLEMELAHVYTLRDGRAARCVEYFDRAEALEAVGLRSSDVAREHGAAARGRSFRISGQEVEPARRPHRVPRASAAS